LCAVNHGVPKAICGFGIAFALITCCHLFAAACVKTSQ
jgi:hypothetical protein